MSLSALSGAVFERLTQLWPDVKMVPNRRRWSVALAIALTVAVAGLLVLSYRTVREWRRSAEMLAERRVEVALTLLSAALNRDMKGAQVSVLLPLELEDILEEPPYGLRDTFLRAFARFSYPESLFIARQDGLGHYSSLVFNRVDRLPLWDRSTEVSGSFPLVVRRDPEQAQPLLNAIVARANGHHRFLVFNYIWGAERYQIVAKVFDGASRDRPSGIVGFTVNLEWVEHHYFSQLALEVSRIGGSADAVALSILDPQGRAVTSTAPLEPGGPVRQRDFLLLFFDPVMLSSLSPGTNPGPAWKAQVAATSDHLLVAAVRGARWMYSMLAVAAIASVVFMLLISHVVRERAELAEMQADFVSTVTHELKTPLVLVRLVGETLAMGRYTSADTIRDYSRLLSQEVSRLTRLIDNLLTLARVTDAARNYTFEAIDIADLTEDVLEEFRPRLEEGGFDVVIDVPANLPSIRGDRAVLRRTLDNLIDNAIKYSTDCRYLAIVGFARNGTVGVEVVDHGIGIAPDEVPLVFNKFYRGRTARTGGSGLGLAIVKRTVEDHGGSIEVTSVLGEGTSVRLLFPSESAHG